MKLNIGCGTDTPAGWINLDLKPPADILANLEEGLPFKEAFFDLIRASHILEHIRDLPALQRELARIMRPGGSLEIIVPYYTSPDAWGDPTHCRGFARGSFLPCFWIGFDLVNIETWELEKAAFQEKVQWLHVVLMRSTTSYLDLPKESPGSNFGEICKNRLAG